ncbi:Hypothetical predicted protein [Pelobates cultripes]|uniref:Uncharacterized protein n=1 Tax=Pelobates cultripes TaxID=61616 RepID=A0AAD1T774_PELCU|nr:Hypothetical predicted protein [Pelobates cultripes]
MVYFPRANQDSYQASSASSTQSKCLCRSTTARAPLPPHSRYYCLTSGSGVNHPETVSKNITKHVQTHELHQLIRRALLTRTATYTNGKTSQIASSHETT